MCRCCFCVMIYVCWINSSTSWNNCTLFAIVCPTTEFPICNERTTHEMITNLSNYIWPLCFRDFLWPLRRRIWRWWGIQFRPRCPTPQPLYVSWTFLGPPVLDLKLPWFEDHWNGVRGLRSSDFESFVGLDELWVHAGRKGLGWSSQERPHKIHFCDANWAILICRHGFVLFGKGFDPGFWIFGASFFPRQRIHAIAQ